MSETTTQQHKLSPKARSAIKAIIAVVAIIVLGSLAVMYGPKEGDSDNVTGDMPDTPTVVVSNLVNSVNIDQQFEYSGVQITLSQAMLATKFSDDRSRGGTYVVRVMVQTRSTAQGPVGIQYADVARLVLPDGTVVAPKRVSVNPLELPNHPQSGFFDFPVSTQVPLAQLKWQFKNTLIPFSK